MQVVANSYVLFAGKIVIDLGRCFKNEIFQKTFFSSAANIDVMSSRLIVVYLRSQIISDFN